LIDKYIKLSDIGRYLIGINSFICLMIIYLDVTLYPFDRRIDESGDSQPTLQWQTRTIISSEGESLSFHYIELEKILLNKPDAQGKGLLHNSILSQLGFRTKLTVIINEKQIF
jgi:hypothetical protein